MLTLFIFYGVGFEAGEMGMQVLPAFFFGKVTFEWVLLVIGVVVFFFVIEQEATYWYEKFVKQPHFKQIEDSSSKKKNRQER